MSDLESSVSTPGQIGTIGSNDESFGSIGDSSAPSQSDRHSEEPRDHHKYCGDRRPLPAIMIDSGSSRRTSDSGSSNFSANISSCGASETKDSDEGEDLSGSDTTSFCESSTEGEASTAGQSIVEELQQCGKLTTYQPNQTGSVGSRDHNVTIRGEGVKPNAAGSSLITAIESGDLTTMKQLMRHGADLQACGSGRRSLLHVACSLGNIEVVRLLLKAGCNIDICSENGRTPLHEACIGGHYKVIQLLMSKVSDLDHTDNIGMTAAHLCSLHGEVDCLVLLCNQGCDICLEDDSGRSAVHLAAMNDHPKVIQSLSERGVEVDTQDKDGKTPAHYAAQHGSMECLKVLLSNDIDLTQGDSAGIQPVHETARCNQLECLKFLLKKGVKMSAQDDRGRSLLHKAAQGGALACLHWLLSTGRLSPDIVDNQGHTPLHCAAAAGQSECYYCLLKHNADPSITNMHRENAFDFARKHGNPQIISKAMDGARKCKYCCQDARTRTEIKPSPIRVKITSKTSLFTKPAHVATTRRQAPPTNITTAHIRKDSLHQTVQQQLMKEERNLAAKYYGPWY